MEINERELVAKGRINKISFAIQTAIDEICKEENFEITYTEINAAILEVMSSNNSYELRELRKENNQLNLLV